MQAERTIKKHVAIIHAYSTMSTLQRKIFNSLLYFIQEDQNRLSSNDTVAVECRIPLSFLIKSIRFNSKNTEYLKESIDDLASLIIEWNLLKDKVPTDISFLNLRVLHGSPTFYQDGTFNFSFHRVLLSLINTPSIYGTIDLDTQAEFDSKYSHALYESSTRFLHLKKDKIIQLDTLRKVFGISPDKYQTTKEFSRNVIKPAVEEVNDRAQFIVKLDAVKVGGKIFGFELAVNDKNRASISSNEKSNSPVKEAIKLEFGSISESVLENIVNHYSESYVLEKINYTKKFAKKEKSGFYPIPYFISALRHDYKVNEKVGDSLTSNEKIPGKSEWQQKLSHLQMDLEHWKRQLDFASSNNKTDLIENTQKVVLTCESKLKEHLANIPQEKDHEIPCV